MSPATGGVKLDPINFLHDCQERGSNIHNRKDQRETISFSESVSHYEIHSSNSLGEICQSLQHVYSPGKVTQRKVAIVLSVIIVPTRNIYKLRIKLSVSYFFTTVKNFQSVYVEISYCVFFQKISRIRDLTKIFPGKGSQLKWPGTAKTYSDSHVKMLQHNSKPHTLTHNTHAHTHAQSQGNVAGISLVETWTIQG